MTAKNPNPYGIKLYEHTFDMNHEHGRKAQGYFIGSFCDRNVYTVHSHDLRIDYGPHVVGEHAILKTEQVDNRDWDYTCRNLIYRGEWLAPDWDVDTAERHFVHLVKDENGTTMLRYIESEAHGMRGRLSIIKPGRYLTKHHPEIDAETVKTLVADLDKETEVHWAHTASEIVAVYTEGPNSCMSKERSYYNGHVHPVAVYGDSDLSVAYLVRKGGDITARVIVWRDKKIFSTAYGDTRRLRNALEAQGYEEGDLDGARIRRIENEKGSGSIMPYVDGIDYCEPSSCGNWFTLGNGSVCAQSTSGIVADHSDCFYCSIYDRWVDNDEGVYVSDMEEYVWDRALENGRVWSCRDTGEVYLSTTHQVITSEGNTYHQEAFDQLGGYYCSISGDAYVPSESKEVYLYADEDVNASLEHAEDTWFQSDCGKWFESEGHYEAHMRDLAIEAHEALSGTVLDLTPSDIAIAA